MTKKTILPSRNIEFGMWGTSQRNGYDALMCWRVASRFLASVSVSLRTNRFLNIDRLVSRNGRVAPGRPSHRLSTTKISFDSG